MTSTENPSPSGPSPAGPSTNPDVEQTQIIGNRLEELDLNDCAIEIRNLKFTYNKSKGNLLDNISLTFPRGAIYGFLGPSGCGKTTLTKLIVGLLRPNSGSIRINGKPMQDPGNHLPGPGVGYMPQDTALFEEFSIYETLNYFSKIYGLPKDYRNKRIDNLMKFLDLPDKHRRVGVLSGGQKRRTSLAVAIIHSPPLLILDEPTVGIDPVLRERVWQHMLTLSSEEHISIMITTHYIEECRRAHVIGLMRNGRLLAENSPYVLLTHFKTDNLENVFLQTCEAEEGKAMDAMPPILAEARRENNPKQVKRPKSTIHFKPTKLERLLCLIMKNLTILFRDIILMFLEILLPVISIFLFALCVGNKPHGLKAALYNEERLNNATPFHMRMSEILIQKIKENSEVFILQNYSSYEEAHQSVVDGSTYGLFHVGFNFSSALTTRATQMFMADDKVIKESTVYFEGDLSDIMMYQTFVTEIIRVMKEFVLEMMKLMAERFGSDQLPNPRFIAPSIELVEPPAYGSPDINFRDFLHPSLVLQCAFFLSLAMTALTMIQERMKGLLDRTLVAGARLSEILAALIIVQAVVLLLQALGILIVTLLIFDFYNEGNFFVIYLNAILQGICGICFGVAISMTFDEMLYAIAAVAGILIPNMIVSGALWPTEAMSYWVRYLSYTLPQTIPIKALRAVILKGWGLDEQFVWLGLFVSFMWSIAFFVYSVVIGSIR